MKNLEKHDSEDSIHNKSFSEQSIPDSEQQEDSQDSKLYSS